MKVDYIDLIVFMCVIPILIGTGYGIYKLLETSSGKNNGIDTSSSTTPVPLSTTTSTTPVPTLTPEYQWVEYKAELCNDTRLMKTEDTSDLSYIIIRLIYTDGRIIIREGMISLANRTITVITKTVEQYHHIELLLIKHGKTEWIPSPNGTIPDNAIEGGKIGNEIIYVCRITDDEHYFAGSMQPSNGSCYDFYDKSYHGTYDLLVLKM